jgi:hypothetical protein
MKRDRLRRSHGLLCSAICACRFVRGLGGACSGVTSTTYSSLAERYASVSSANCTPAPGNVADRALQAIQLQNAWLAMRPHFDAVKDQADGAAHYNGTVQHGITSTSETLRTAQVAYAGHQDESMAPLT